MPGIAGFIAAPSSGDRPEVLSRMAASLKHEPFYHSDSLWMESLGLGVAWVCHPGSYSDCLPAWNETRDVCLIFSGEHFSDRTDADRIRGLGHAVNPDNASWLVHAYEADGEAFLQNLNGCFRGLLIDLRTRKIILFNDRFGLGRVYVHEGADGFYFASEAKALLKALPNVRQLDPAGFAELLSCGCPLQNRSIFSGISLLPPASAWSLSRGEAPRKSRYFDPAQWENQAELPAEQYYLQMQEIFTRILPNYFRGNQPVALSLTGGLDSRMIIAGQPAAPGQLPCYTFGGMYRECADVRLARQIATACGQPHQVIPVGSGFFSEFPGLAQRTVYCSDGAMDVMGAVELYVNRQARRLAPVRMTGNYGSEVLRSNVAFKPIPLAEGMFEQGFERHLAAAAETYAAERRAVRTSFIAFKQVPWLHHARLSVEQTQLTLRSPFLDNALVAAAYRAPAELAVNKALALRYVAEQKPSLAHIPTDRGVIGYNGSSRGKLAAFRQELLPRVEYAFDYGMPQWLARIDRYLAPLHVERLFIGRQKFYHFRTWYRDELSAYVKAVLLDPQALGRSHLRARRVEAVVKAHVRGQANYTWEIHKLLTSELIYRHLIEQ